MKIMVINGSLSDKAYDIVLILWYFLTRYGALVRKACNILCYMHRMPTMLQFADILCRWVTVGDSGCTTSRSRTRNAGGGMGQLSRRDNAKKVVDDFEQPIQIAGVCKVFHK